MLVRKKGIALLENPGMLICAENWANTVGSHMHAEPVGPLAFKSDLICEQHPPIEKLGPAVLQPGAMPMSPAPPPMESMRLEQVPTSMARAGAASRRAAQRAERASSLAKDDDEAIFFRVRDAAKRWKKRKEERCFDCCLVVVLLWLLFGCRGG